MDGARDRARGLSACARRGYSFRRWIADSGSFAADARAVLPFVSAGLHVLAGYHTRQYGFPDDPAPHRWRVGHGDSPSAGSGHEGSAAHGTLSDPRLSGNTVSI